MLDCFDATNLIKYPSLSKLPKKLDRCRLRGFLVNAEDLVLLLSRIDIRHLYLGFIELCEGELAAIVAYCKSTEAKPDGLVRDTLYTKPKVLTFYSSIMIHFHSDKTSACLEGPDVLHSSERVELSGSEIADLSYCVHFVSPIGSFQNTLSWKLEELEFRGAIL